jgi:RNA polymerase sigma factor (sigma-70 family)
MQHAATHISVSNDQPVIEKILQGETALFEVLIRRYNPVLYRIAKSHGFNHQDAEDLMQDAHISAYMALKDFGHRSTYKTWISRIMVNKCLYKLKYGYHKNEVPSEKVTEPIHQPMHVKSKENQTEDVFLNRELTLVLEKSLHNIPVMYRTVFVLREVEGFSVAETSGLLDITEMNVKIRLSRAKAMLRKQVEQFYSHADLYSFNLVYCDAIVQKVFEKINELREQEKK